MQKSPLPASLIRGSSLKIAKTPNNHTPTKHPAIKGGIALCRGVSG
jgi:hypothetical protein